MIYNQIVTWTAFAILAMFYIQDGQRDDSLIVDKDDSLKKISIQNPD